ncbi:MAG: hypothetical protein OXE77_08580 [Flavobacteriaceae bacterium]|nr:hypothetical protein [Flavobacteriaceae bacterium]MCY4267271.1 hypothetical protein [Flavobacteriaceae bacterium]
MKKLQCTLIFLLITNIVHGQTIEVFTMQTKLCSSAYCYDKFKVSGDYDDIGKQTFVLQTNEHVDNYQRAQVEKIFIIADIIVKKYVIFWRLIMPQKDIEKLIISQIYIDSSIEFNGDSQEYVEVKGFNTSSILVWTNKVFDVGKSWKLTTELVEESYR